MSETGGTLKIWRNFGNFGNSRKILAGGLWILGIVFATPKNRDYQAVRSRNRARRRADRDVPNLTPPKPGTPILATRFGPHVPKSQKFRKSGEISEISKIPEKSWRGAYGSWACYSRPRKIETLKLLAPEIGPSDVLIATPRIRSPSPEPPF